MTKEKKQNKKSVLVDKLNDKTKETFIIDIHNLRHQLDSFGEKAKDGEKKKEILKEKIKTSFAGKDELLKKYNGKADEKTQAFLDLHGRIMGQEERRLFESESRRDTLLEAREKLTKMKNNYVVENKHLVMRLKRNEDFKYVRNEMVRRAEDVRSDIEKNKINHGKQIEDLKKDRKNEIRIIKNEALEKLERAGRELKEDCLNKMPLTIKRTNSEHDVIQGYLGKMGHFSEENEDKNNKSREAIATNSVVCRKLVTNEKKLLQEYVATKKVIQLMENKSEEFERKKDEFRNDKRMIEELENEIEGINKLLEDSKLEKFKSETLKCGLNSSISKYNEEIEKYEKDIYRLQMAIQRAVKPLESTLFANRSARKDHYLKEHLDKYRDVLVDVHSILQAHQELDAEVVDG